MSDIPHNDNAFNSKALFCPACGSASVDSSSLSGGEASCGICTWKGKSDELAAIPFGQASGSPEAILHQIFLDIRKFMSAGFATQYLDLLLKWGFLTEQPINVKQVSRYMGVTCMAIARSLIEERTKIEKEAHKDG